MLQKIREKAEIPAIFLTARDEETDMLTAFDTGADDYVVKPFSMKVLLKRIEAVIGRNNREKQLACGEIILFPDKKQVYKNEKEIILTAREYQLLEYLMYNQGNVLTKENILEYVWGLDGQFVVDNTVSVTINRLRKKIETDAGSPIYLKMYLDWDTSWSASEKVMADTKGREKNEYHNNRSGSNGRSNSGWNCHICLSGKMQTERT